MSELKLGDSTLRFNLLYREPTSSSLVLDFKDLKESDALDSYKTQFVQQICSEVNMNNENIPLLRTTLKAIDEIFYKLMSNDKALKVHTNYKKFDRVKPTL